MQEWYSGDWPKPSKVTFTLTYKDGCTTLYFTHEDVPPEEINDIDDGWESYNLGEIRKLLEK